MNQNTLPSLVCLISNSTPSIFDSIAFESAPSEFSSSEECSPRCAIHLGAPAKALPLTPKNKINFMLRKFSFKFLEDTHEYFSENLRNSLKLNTFSYKKCVTIYEDLLFYYQKSLNLSII